MCFYIKTQKTFEVSFQDCEKVAGKKSQWDSAFFIKDLVTVGGFFLTCLVTTSHILRQQETISFKETLGTKHILKMFEDIYKLARKKQ